LRIGHEPVRKEFQRDESVEFSVFGRVNNTHPADAEFFDDAVARDGLLRTAALRMLALSEQLQILRTPGPIGLVTGSPNQKIP
jgi:hypothetical protein